MPTFRAISRTVNLASPSMISVKPVLNGHSQTDQKLVFKTNYSLMQVRSIAEGSKGSIAESSNGTKGAFCNIFDQEKLPFVI